MENKMTVIAKDGTALIGNHFHTLNDESELSFTTDDIYSFMTFIRDDELPDFNIYYHGAGVVAMPKEFGMNTIAIAICKLEETLYIQTLRSLNDKKLSIEDAERVMRLFRPFSGVAGKQVLDFCRGAHIEDTIKIDREKSNTGDYEFSVTRKKSGKEQWTCPESISFKVPIFKNIEEERQVIFETSFDYEEVEGKVKMMFTFSNIDFENIIDLSKRQIVTELFKDFACPKYWGAATVQKMTDGWKYKANPLTNC